jgi:hypothetical protein
MNPTLVDSLIQLISALSDDDRQMLEQRLFFDEDYPSPLQLSTLAQAGQAFDFLDSEPDLYSAKQC